MGKSSSISKPRVLFVDDDEASTRALIRTLSRQSISFECHAEVTADGALSALSRLTPEVAVVDLSLDPSVGPSSGLELITRLIVEDSSLRILVLTGHDSETYGLKALQLGAASFLQKPVSHAHLLALIDDGINYARLKRSYQELSSSPSHLKSILGLSSRSPQMSATLEAVAFSASNSAPVLIIGETGTGKGVLARAIHQAGLRHKGPFIRFQPSFGSADLVSSELFGHQRGAFTGATENRKGLIEEANKGTLFIDEVDELPPETQVVLLNVLQEKAFRPLGQNRELRSDFRLIAATNRSLEELQTHSRLRPDFYHRVAHSVIEIPPLRERTEDIPELAETFLTELANRESLTINGFTREAMARLVGYSWPGNVRQLQSAVESGVARANYRSHKFVEADDLSLGKLRGKLGGSFRDRVRSFELQVIREALTRNNNNQSKAANSLDLDRTTLRRILGRDKSAV